MIKRIKITLLCLTALFFSLGFCFLSAQTAGVNNAFALEDQEMTLVSQNVIEQEYCIDQYFDVPEYSFTFNGQTQVATSVLYSPSKKAYDSNKIKLNETGTWTIEYSAFENQKYSVSFIVYKSTYEVTSDGGSIKYESNSIFTKSDKGLVVKLPKGSTFKYNEVIDLSNATKSDNIIEFGVIPNSLGTPDMSRVYVYLTDIYNPDNYIVYRLVNPNNRESGYGDAGCVAASFSGAGHFMGTEHVKEYDGVQKLTYHVDSLYFGSFVPFSFAGTTVKLGSREPVVALSYDATLNEAHSATKMWYGIDMPQNLGHRTIIAELGKTDYSDARLSGKQGFVKPFGGFTTGEVYLSIVADDYSSANCNFFIKSIMGADFTQQKTYDQKRPHISIDDSFDQSNLPNAVVGTPYTIFSADVVDNELQDVRLSRKVFYSYNGVRLYRLNITDNQFTPNKTGTYEIVYSSTDGFGNLSEKSLFVQAVESIDKPIIIEPSNVKTEYFVGETVYLTIPKVQSFCGEASLSVLVKHNGGPVEITNNSFVLEKAGVYEVEFIAKDYINQQDDWTYNINCEYSEKPILEENVVLPRAFIHGATYTLPNVSAYWYNNGVRTLCTPTISVIDKAGERDLQGFTYVANGPDIESVSITYKYSCDIGETSKTFSVPIVNPYSFPAHFVKYFMTDGNVEILQSSNQFALDFSGDGKVDFIKALSVSKLDMEFVIAQENNVYLNDALSFDIILSEVSNPDKYVVISIKKVSDMASKISVNGGKEQDFTAVFTGGAPFTVNYTNDNKIILAKSTQIVIETYADGTEFNGFEDGLAYATFSATQAVNFRVGVNLINDQSFTFFTSDFNPPKVFVEGGLKSHCQINETIYTNIAYGIDVLQENCTTTVSVVSPSGKTVLNKKPANQIYSVVLEEYGVYSIKYVCIDAKNAKTQKTMYVTVEDRIAPELSLSMGSFKCDAGKVISLPTATVSDNLSKAEDLQCYLSYLDPMGREYSIDMVRNGNVFSASFNFNIPGVWKLKYLVYDQDFNVQTKEITAYVGDCSKPQDPVKDVEFVKNGQSEYVIIVPDIPEGSEMLAAYNVRDYIFKSSGCMLEILTNSQVQDFESIKFLSIGITDAYNSKNFNFDFSNYNEGFIIKESDSNIYIIGGLEDKSYLYASYEFLSVAIGLEPYYLSEVYFDYKLDINLIRFDLDFIPTFDYRSFINTEISSSDSPGEYQDYIKYEEVKFTNIGYAHTIFNLINPSVYYAEHKDWFTGTTDKDQLCWSQQDMLEELAKKVIESFQRDSSATHIHIGQNDGNNWCSCTACAKAKEDYGTDSAVLIKGLNFVAKKLQEYIDENEPGREVYISTFAYNKTTNAPVKKDANGNYIPFDDSVKAEPNIVVRVAPVDTDYAYTFYDEPNMTSAEAIKAWSAICDSVLIWNYNTNFSFYFIPFCNWNTTQDNYTFFEENNVTGVVEQGAPRSKQTGFWECRIYLESKLLWNNHLNVNDLINDFFTKYYKDASPWVYKYFDEYRQWFNIIQKQYSLITGGIYARFDSVPNAFPLAVVERWEEYLENAKAEIEYIKDINLELYNELYRRIDKETLFFDYVKIFNLGSEFSDDELRELRINFKAKCQLHDINQLDEGGSLESIYKSWGI